MSDLDNAVRGFEKWVKDFTGKVEPHLTNVGLILDKLSKGDIAGLAKDLGLALMHWEKPEDAVIDLKAKYIVRTNGDKYGDGCVYMWPGFLIAKQTEPNVVRGRVLWVCKIEDTPDGQKVNN